MDNSLRKGYCFVFIVCFMFSCFQTTAAEAAAKAAAAEADARLRVAQARLDAEEKLLSLSELESCVTGG